MDPRTPILVGVAQSSQRADTPDQAREPVELMARVARAAERDAGVEGLLARTDSVRVVQGVWPYRDPGRLVAARLGMREVRTSLTEIGGNAAQDLPLGSADDVRAGRRDVVLVCAAETMRTRRRDRRAGRRTRYAEEPPGAAPDESFADPRPLLTDAEAAAGIGTPVVFYALVETALRRTLGEDAEAHGERIAGLWASLSRVAAGNPHAWTRQERGAEEIRRVGPANRWIAYPYPKWMTANVDVDQAVAVLPCSVEAARSLGVPRDRWVFPWAGAHAHDHWSPSERERLDASPAMRLAGRAVLERARLGPDDLELVDLYACFPSAVQVAQRELGLPLDRVPSVTGGLTFAGGPFNSTVLHGVARLVERLREEPRSRGLVIGNGGYFTKHSFGVYAAEPPPGPFLLESPQAAIDALPRARVAPEHRGPARVEAWTVAFAPDGTPESGVVAVRTPDGARLWARGRGAELTGALLAGEACGRPVRVEGPRLLAVG